LRSFRAFRTISFIRALQVIVSALILTIRKGAVDILILLFLLMFIFGVLGHYLFGLDGTAATKANWGTLGDSIYTLWSYVVADNWYPIQESLTSAGFDGSEVYTALFIFVGNFIITNLFIGVICQVFSFISRDF
jgi:cation channel sperm-associated protein 3